MPTYRFNCNTCGEVELWHSIHQDHPKFHSCGASMSIILGPVRANISHISARIDSTERQWSKDMDAYKRLRHAGHQPQGIDGADRLEATAQNAFEVDTSLKLGHLPEEKVKEAKEMVRDIEAGRV